MGVQESDGGEIAARGFLYQYVRTLEALLDAVERDDVAAVHVEGMRTDDNSAQSIDYELTDRSGQTMIAVQVKSRAPSGSLDAAGLYRALSGLAQDRVAPRYQVITNARLGASAETLIAALEAASDGEDLRRRLGRVLSPGKAPRANAHLHGLPAEILDRMRAAGVVVDPREDTEVHEDLRVRLRKYRDGHRAGLGDESAGLMAGYLISEIFRGAADPARAKFTVDEIRSKLLVNGATLISALGRRDWGVVIGPVPGWPDVYRREIIAQLSATLPRQETGTAVRRCALTGMSGIGKSVLAAGYILEHADQYEAVYWVDAESEQVVHGSFARVLMHLAGSWDNGAPGSPQLRDRVHDMLGRSAGRWLMIFDNCC